MNYQIAFRAALGETREYIIHAIRPMDRLLEDPDLDDEDIGDSAIEMVEDLMIALEQVDHEIERRYGKREEDKE